MNLHHFAHGARVGGRIALPAPLPLLLLLPDPPGAVEFGWAQGAMHSSPPGPLMNVRSGASRGWAEGVHVATKAGRIERVCVWERCRIAYFERFIELKGKKIDILVMKGKSFCSAYLEIAYQTGNVGQLVASWVPLHHTIEVSLGSLVPSLEVD